MGTSYSFACQACGDSEDETGCDLTHCAGCGQAFCDDCIDWCHAPEDEDRGDWFCENCQMNASATRTRD